MEILLRTGQMLLRQFTVDDADALFELDADPAVMRYITGGPGTPMSEVLEDVIPAFLAYHRAGAEFGFFAAEDAADGSFLGWFHLRPEPGAPATEPELGYRLRRSCWGRGLATEGARALIDHAFTARTVEVERVAASTMVANTASRRVMEKSGMALVRNFIADWPVRNEGDEHGDVEYAITRAAWLAAGSAAS